MRYPLAAPDLTGNERAYVDECLRTNWISWKGRFVTAFEESVATLAGRKHAIATCNGTIALHLALLGLGLGPGDEVIVPSLTYVATANAVTYCGAQPVFADSRAESWCVDPASIHRLVTARTRGIIPVHLYGHPCDMDAIGEVAADHGLWVVEDAAEAIGASWRGHPIGSFGASSVFSFFANKIVTTGEGGMVVTDDDDLAARMRLLRGQGMDPERVYWFPVLGYNFRMTNIAAAIGLAQMERIETLVASRRRIAGWYQERLSDVRTLTLPAETPGASSVFWLYSVLVANPARRDALMRQLAAGEIETRPFFHPLHELPMYREAPSDRGCPVATGLAARGINLPTSPYLGESDVDAIARALRELLA